MSTESELTLLQAEHLMVEYSLCDIAGNSTLTRVVNRNGFDESLLDGEFEEQKQKIAEALRAKIDSIVRAEFQVSFSRSKDDEEIESGMNRGSVITQDEHIHSIFRRRLKEAKSMQAAMQNYAKALVDNDLKRFSEEVDELVTETNVITILGGFAELVGDLKFIVTELEKNVKKETHDFMTPPGLS